MLEPDYAPQLNHTNIHQGSNFDQSQDPSSATLPVPQEGHPPIDAEGVLSTPIRASQNLAAMSGKGSSETFPDIYEDRLHQLLRLQSESYKITSPATSSNFSSSFLPEGPGVHGRSTPLCKSSISSLDTILGNTQTLIDILQMSSLSPAAVSHIPQNSAGILQVHPSSASDMQNPLSTRPSHPLDDVTTLLSMSCYLSLLVAYDGLIASLLSSPNDQGDQGAITVKPTSLSSPSLTFGTFSMTSRSNLFVSTVIHVIKKMVQQLQDTFQETFFRAHNATSGATASLERNDRSDDQVGGACGGFETGTPIISCAHSVLVDISEREKRLLQVLAAQR